MLNCLLVGIITAFAAKNKSINPQLLLILKVGICGGFTTFSTFAYETADLLQNGRSAVALAYVLTSVLTGVLAVLGAQMLIK